MARQIFEGIKVLDFGWGAVAPLATKWLADYGATVVLVENHIRPSINRASGPFYGYNMGSPEHAWWSIDYNTSKYSITINLTNPKTTELVKRLIVEWQPNILMEAFRPGVMKKAGLDYESVSEWKPDIIYYSTCLMGQYGPHCNQLGYGTVSTNCSGPSFLTGWPDRGPAGQYGAFSDYVNVGFSNAMLAAALLYQRRTGKGLHIDHSQYEALTQSFAAPIMDYFVSGRVMNRDGNRLPYAAPHGVYPCKGEDRWVAIAVFTDEEWRSFCQVIGNPDWARDEKLATLVGRKSNEDELDRLVGEWTRDFTAEQVEAMMQARGVAANVVESAKDFFEDPQIKYYNFYREFDHPVIGKVHVEGPAITLSKCPDGQRRAPLFGEHNGYVFKEFLGLTDDEIADLIVDGVITTEADLPKPPERKE